MPHCIVEYSDTLSAKLEPQALLEVIHNSVIESDLFEASHVRTRGNAYEHFIMGYPIQDFIHVSLKILSGRTQQQKKNLTSLVLGKLEEIGLSSISLTVEVIDIERETYSRKIIPT